MGPGVVARCIGLLMPGLASLAVHAQLACTADLTLIGQGQVAIAITTRPDGAFDAGIDGVITHAGGRVADEPVRPGLDLAADPAGAAYAGFNGAERSLAHLHRVLALPGSQDLVRLPFAPAQVRRLKTFDLTGRPDKFGGQVLLEAYDEAGRLLGRVVRRIVVAECR